MPSLRRPFLGILVCGALVGVIGCSSAGSGNGDGGNGSGGAGGGGSGGSGGSGGASDMGVGGGVVDLATVPCTLSLSGATPASYTCILYCTQYTAMQTVISFGPPQNSQPYNNWILTLQRNGTSDGSGQWSSADPNVSFNVLAGIDTGTSVSSWSASVNHGTPAGSYKLQAQVSGICDPTHDPTYSITGTLSATLVPVAGTDATGNLQLTATF
jgi:hypothetical protein